MVRGSGCLVGSFLGVFFVLFYLTLKIEEVQSAIPIFPKVGEINSPNLRVYAIICKFSVNSISRPDSVGR